MSPEDKLAERELFGSSSSSEEEEEEEEEEEGVESADDDDEASDPHFELLPAPASPAGSASTAEPSTARRPGRSSTCCLRGSRRGGRGRKRKGGRQRFLPRRGLAPLGARPLCEGPLLGGCAERFLAEGARGEGAAVRYGRLKLVRELFSEEEKKRPRARGKRRRRRRRGRENRDRKHGLRQHVDLPRFADGVAIFSLGADAVMRFEEREGNNGSSSSTAA